MVAMAMGPLVVKEIQDLLENMFAAQLRLGLCLHLLCISRKENRLFQLHLLDDHHHHCRCLSVAPFQVLCCRVALIDHFTALNQHLALNRIYEANFKQS